MNNGVGSLGKSIEGLSNIMGDKAQQSLTGFQKQLNDIKTALDNG